MKSSLRSFLTPENRRIGAELRVAPSARCRLIAARLVAVVRVGAFPAGAPCWLGVRSTHLLECSGCSSPFDQGFPRSGSSLFSSPRGLGAPRPRSAFASLTLSLSGVDFSLPGSVERLGRASPPQRLFSASKGRVRGLRCLSRHRARYRYYTPGLGPQERDVHSPLVVARLVLP